jgi:hypothetical protein
MLYQLQVPYSNNWLGAGELKRMKKKNRRGVTQSSIRIFAGENYKKKKKNLTIPEMDAQIRTCDFP